MTWLSTLLTAAILALSMPLLQADDPEEKRSARQEAEKRKEWSKLSVEERETRLKEWRRTNDAARAERDKWRDEFRKMSPEQREAKRKEIRERLEKRIGELRAKAKNGTLSQQEKRELERCSQVLKRFKESDQKAEGGERKEPRTEPGEPKKPSP